MLAKEETRAILLPTAFSRNSFINVGRAGFDADGSRASLQNGLING